MALLVPHEGELQLLTDMIGGGTLENWQLCLFNSNITPSETDTAATYTAHETAFPGYARVTLTRSISSSTWNTPVSQAPSGSPPWSSRALGRPHAVWFSSSELDVRHDRRHHLRILHHRRHQRQIDLRRGVRDRAHPGHRRHAEPSADLRERLIGSPLAQRKHRCRQFMFRPVAPRVFQSCRPAPNPTRSASVRRHTTSTLYLETSTHNYIGGYTFIATVASRQTGTMLAATRFAPRRAGSCPGT